MANIIPGAQLSCYKTIAISLGQSKKENNNGVKSNFIVLSVKNKKSLLSGTRRIVLFDEDIPGAFNALKAYASNTPDAQGGYLVDLTKMKADTAVMAEWEGLLEFPGGMVVEYPLRKGLCYQNDIDGKVGTEKNTNTPIMKDRVNVFVQVDFATVDENGRMSYVYIDRFGLSEQGQRMESRFYRNAVEQVTATNTDDTVINAEQQQQGSEQQQQQQQQGRPF